MSLQLFTIGHSDHSVDDFIALLRSHGVDAIADVRSQPYSRRHAQFNRESLKADLHEAGIRYVFLGQECGARSEDPACYDEGRVQYARLAQTPLFHQGLERIRTGAERFTLSLMCAEKDPVTCHRFLLVSRALVEQGTEVRHILADGSVETHAQAMSRLRGQLGLLHPDFFSTDAEQEARAYQQQEERVAYAPEDTGTEDDPVAEIPA